MLWKKSQRSNTEKCTQSVFRNCTAMDVIRTIMCFLNIDACKQNTKNNKIWDHLYLTTPWPCLWWASSTKDINLKQLVTCSSIFTKGAVTLGHHSQCLGTISSFALICIWCFNEYLPHQDCSCGIDPEQAIVATFLVITFHPVQQLGSQICF